MGGGGWLGYKLWPDLLKHTYLYLWDFACPEVLTNPFPPFLSLFFAFALEENASCFQSKAHSEHALIHLWLICCRDTP